VSITNGYATLNQLKSWIGVGTADTMDDPMFEMAVESASRMVDDDCDRVFYASGTAVARVFSPADNYLAHIDDAIAITAVATDQDGTGVYSTVWTSGTDYQLEPLNGISGGQPWPYTRIRAVGSKTFPNGVMPYSTDFGEATLQVTGQWGFGTAVPIAITQATLILAARIAKRGDSPLGIAGFGDMGALRVTRNDPDYMNLISRYQRMKVATA